MTERRMQRPLDILILTISNIIIREVVEEDIGVEEEAKITKIIINIAKIQTLIRRIFINEFY